MANLDFYALGDDLCRLFEFIYAEADAVVYEHSSEFDCELRKFESLEALRAARYCQMSWMKFEAQAASLTPS